jgi:hypothetical protein
VAERKKCTVALERGEPSQPPPCDVLEEDALDRLLRTEGEDLVERRTDVPDGLDDRTL